MSHLMSDVLAVADFTDADDFYLAGHDFGAAITWSMATFAPERLRKVVTLAAPHPRS